MKGALTRFRKRQACKSYANSMAVYEATLQKLVEVNGDGKSYRQDNDSLNFKVREGEVVAIRCVDNDFYYVTGYIKRNQLTGNLEKFLSNPVMGTTPDGMREVPAEMFLKQFREMNNGNFRAFPFAQGEPMS
tara:strand:+ start:134 stop:529 length:396 start_codon:yes stop_codon:yes gene_type:complete